MRPIDEDHEVDDLEANRHGAISLIENSPHFHLIGERDRRRKIAFLRRQPATLPLEQEKLLPGLFWLGGFMSSMTSIKAGFVDSLAAVQNRACLRFDYSGHGLSEGDFQAARIGDWLAESLDLFRTRSEGPQILIGSSMGGWLALLLARVLAKSAETSRLAGLVLIAPATDFTEKLIWDRFSPEMQSKLISGNVVFRPSDYSADPIPITRGLIEEGRNHLLLGEPIRTYCPVHILQGMQDKDVPWRHAVTLTEHIAGDNVALSLIKDGDHRLSRPEDLERLRLAIEAFC